MSISSTSSISTSIPEGIALQRQSEDQSIQKNGKDQSIQKNGKDQLIQKKSKDLTTQDFMKLLVYQLANQNPLEPMSSSDMMGQISALTSSRLSESLDLFSKNQNSALGQGMLGHEVVVHTIDNEGNLQEVCGVVSAIEDIGKDTCKIEVNGKFYKPSSVVRISSHAESLQSQIDTSILGKKVLLDDEGTRVLGEVKALSNAESPARVLVGGKWYKANTIKTIRLKEEA